MISINKNRRYHGKRGIAMETAIGYLMLTFAFCLLLTTVFYCVVVQNARSRRQREERILLDAIGQRYKIYVENASYDTLDGGFDTDALYEGDNFLTDDGFPTKAELQDKYSFNYVKGADNTAYVSTFTLEIRDKKDDSLKLKVTVRRNTLPSSAIEYTVTEWTDR